MQPQWTSAAGRVQPQSSSPSATGTAEMAVAAASMDMAQLSSKPMDIKRWINNALRHQAEEIKASKDDGHTIAATASLEERAVNRLFSKMQAHAQQIGSSVEESISQSIVRLPRTTMELQRMIVEANELSVQLQTTRDVVKPAVEERGQSQTHRLNELRDAQARLRRCQSVLQQALAVDSSITTIAEATQQLQREQRKRVQGAKEGALDGRIDARRKTNGETSGSNSIGPSSSFTSQVNVASLSIAIREVKRDLQELQAVDPSYGEKHRVSLEKHEEVIEQVLEHECLSYLAGHDAMRAAELLRPLHDIGRADVVLQAYAKAVTADCIAAMTEALGGSGSVAASGAADSFHPEGHIGVSTTLSAAHAAKALKDRVVPVIRATLESELNYLFLLSDCMSTSKSSGGDASAPSSKENVVRMSTSAAGNGESTPSVKTAADGSPPLSDGSPSSRNKGDQLQVAMSLIIDLLGGAFKTLMGPILDKATQNVDIIACYDATRSVKVSAANLPAASNATPSGRESGSGEGEAAVGEDSSSSPAPAKTARLGAREKATMQASSQALNAFVAVFQRESVMAGVCARTAARIATAAGGLGIEDDADDNAAPSNNRKGHIGAAKASTAQVEQNAALLSLLQNNHVQLELTAALLDGVRDVLHFFPDQSLGMCVQRWSRTLSSLFHALFPAAGAAGDIPKAPGPTAGTKTSMALVKLSLIVKCARPAVELMKKEVNAFLTSAEVQNTYPSSANTALTSLSSNIWTPLLASLDAAVKEAQHVAKESILDKILSTVARYDELPAWGRRRSGSDSSKAQVGGKSGMGSESLKAPLASYRPGHVTPSEAVREFGESVMGAPLALESLRDEIGSVDSLLADFFFSSQSSRHISSSLAAMVKTGIEDLLDEKAAVWLDDIVGAAVSAFVEETVSSVRIDFSPLPQPSAVASASAADETEALKKIAHAWEQLTADLEYLRNVLSAVSEEEYAELESCLETIRALPTPSRSAPFVVGQKLRELRQSQAE